MCRVSQDHDEQIGKQQSVLVVRGPQRPPTEIAAVGVGDDADIGPLISPDHVDAELLNEPEVSGDR